MKSVAKIIADAMTKFKCKMSCCCQSKCSMGDIPTSPTPTIKNSVDL